MKNLEYIRDYLRGKKTHIIATLMILVSATELLTGDISLVEFLTSENLNMFLEGCGLSSIRAAIAKNII